MFANIILMADKHNMPKVKMHSNCRLLPDHIVSKITPRNRHNTHIHWKTIYALSNRAPPPTLNTSITFSNQIVTKLKHIANSFTKQFTNTRHTRQTDTLTERHIKYKDITSNPQIWSKRQYNKVKIQIHKVLTN